MISRTPTSPCEVLYSIYGRTPPVSFLGRLKAEHGLIKRGFFDDQMLITDLRLEAYEDYSDVDVTGNYSAVLLNWVYGSSRVNPLMPHYFCETCQKVILRPDVADGWDLPPMECCGKPMTRDGHQIPLEETLQRLSHPDWQLDLRIAESFADKAVEIIKKHYKRDFTVVPYVADEEENVDLSFVLVPKDAELPALDEDGVWHTYWDELHQHGFRVIKIYFIKIKEQLRTYRRETDLRPPVDELLTAPVLAVTQAKLTSDILEEGGTPLKSDTLSFSSLLRTIGYLESAHTPYNPMLTDEEARYTDIFTCPEDIWTVLGEKLKPEHGISTELIKDLVKKTRSAAYIWNRMDPETEQLLRGIGLSDHWITQMKETEYLRGRADLINHLLDRLELTWFELRERFDGEGTDHFTHRFMLYNGELRPSDSYLETHPMPDYRKDDWYNAAYDYRQDEEVFLTQRTCEKCGKTFTLPEAAERVKSYFKPYPIEYAEHFKGEVCGDCAIKEIESIFTRDEEILVEAARPTSKRTKEVS